MSADGPAGPVEPEESPNAAPVPPGAALFALFNEIGIIEQLSRNRFQRVMPDGMQISHFSVLNHFVRVREEASPVQLARAFQVSKPSMTNTLQRLEAAGYVAIRPDPRDGRAKRVTITPAGRAARDAAIAALIPQMGWLAERIPPERLLSILPVLQELRALLDAARDGDPDGGGPG
ncbi:MAG: MarR family transcriptional regulator [Pseudomonadota bacterium]